MDDKRYRELVENLIEQEKADRMLNYNAARIPLHASVTNRQIRTLFDRVDELEKRVASLENA